MGYITSQESKGDIRFCALEPQSKAAFLPPPPCPGELEIARGLHKVLCVYVARKSWGNDGNSPN